MDPFDLELKKLELEDIMMKTRKKLKEMEVIDIEILRLLLKHIEKKAIENIKNIIALEKVMYQNIG